MSYIVIFCGSIHMIILIHAAAKIKGIGEDKYNLTPVDGTWRVKQQSKTRTNRNKKLKMINGSQKRK